MKVFVVTEGTYSDFGINSIWSSRHGAQMQIIKLKYNNGWYDCDIEEYELDDDNGQIINEEEDD